MKWVKKISFILVILLAITYFVSWKSPRYFVPATQYQSTDSLVLFENYTGEHPRPYIIQDSNLVIFGAEHTRNPDDPQINTITEVWQQLKPSIALVEGRLGFLLPGLMDPVKHLGEGGYVRALARKQGIATFNWDFSKEELAKALLQKFSAQQIALYQILSPYFSQLRFGKPDSPEAFIKKYLSRSAYVGLKDSIQNVADVDSIWNIYFPAGPDWRNTTDEYTLPGYLNNLMAVTNDLRNQRLLTIVKELTGKGEKVFLICGSSHAFCVAPALGTSNSAYKSE